MNFGYGENEKKKGKENFDVENGKEKPWQREG